MRILRVGGAAFGLWLGFQSEAAAYCRATSCACKPNTDATIYNDAGQPLVNEAGVPQTMCGQPDGECPRDENGCQIRGTPNAWAGGCVGFSPNLAGTSQLSADQYTAAFDTAFQAWAMADCGGGKHPSIQAFMLRPTTCAASAYNADGPNVNTVYFTDDGWDSTSAREIDAILARTKTHFDSAGVIFDADMEINSAGHDFTVSDDPGESSYDLVSVITHEAGHFYGLDHSPDQSAIMFFALDPQTIKRDLSADDVAAICAAYPPDRVASCDPTPKGGLEDSCAKPSLAPGCASAPDEAHGSGGVAALVSILGVTVVWARRKRGRGR